MQVDTKEILFIRENAPRSFFALIADNVNIPRAQVKSEFYSLKKEYNPVIIQEARRLLKEIKGLVYKESELC